MLNQMIGNNPMAQQLFQQNPEMQRMFQDPEFMRQMMDPQNIQMAMNLQRQMGGVGGGMAGFPGFAVPPVQPGQQAGGASGANAAPNPANPANPANPNAPPMNFMIPPNFAQFYGAPAAAAPAANPEERFAVQLQQLQDMGFNNRAVNVRVLTQTNGNVEVAVERLLQGL